jgi:hypothetical protein
MEKSVPKTKKFSDKKSSFLLEDIEIVPVNSKSMRSYSVFGDNNANIIQA